MDKMQIYNFSETQLIAMDLIAYTPGITNKDIAKQLNVAESTISAWRGNPAFIDFPKFYGASFPLEFSPTSATVCRVNNLWFIFMVLIVP